VKEISLCAAIVPTAAAAELCWRGDRRYHNTVNDTRAHGVTGMLRIDTARRSAEDVP